MFEPLVSIIIPVYNGSNYMREAIDSALAQSYRKREIIVINDGSTDNGETERIAQSYGDKIRYFSKENGGVSSALNMGIAKMQGEYFSWLSHDDVYTTNKIEISVNALRDRNMHDSLVYCDSIQIDKNSKEIKSNNRNKKFKCDGTYDSDYVLRELLTKGTLNGCCLLIPKGVFDKCGLFDEKLRFCQDALMWYHIFSNGYSLTYIGSVGVKSRVHDKQLTQTGQRLFKKECNEISEELVIKFRSISDGNYNFLKLYLVSDARYLNYEKIHKAFYISKDDDLLSLYDKIYILGMFGYGQIRPCLRKLYYMFFRKIR